MNKSIEVNVTDGHIDTFVAGDVVEDSGKVEGMITILLNGNLLKTYSDQSTFSQIYGAVDIRLKVSPQTLLRGQL